MYACTHTLPIYVSNYSFISYDVRFGHTLTHSLTHSHTHTHTHSHTHTLTHSLTHTHTQTVKLSSVEKLIRHVESSQLTADLGGFLPYNHDEWIKLRLVSVKV